MTDNSIHGIASNLPISFPPIYGENISGNYAGVTISIERITPAIAAKMLETNVHNRDPKREAIAKSIRDGKWKLNGATIVFDPNGILRDGQNRLMACVKANMPIDTIVVRGVVSEAQITMDTGVKRALVDYLKLDGYTNCNIVGAIGLMIYRSDTYGLQSAFTLPIAGRDTIQNVYEFIGTEYGTRIGPLVKSVKALRTEYGVKAGTSGALFDTFKRAGEDNLDEFVQQLLNRKAACASVRLLQNKLRKDKDSKYGRLPQRVVAALIIKAWNAYMRGDEISLLRFTQGGANPENFPEVFLGYE